MVDANHAYNAVTAIQVGRELEKCQVFWFEEPVIPEDLQGYLEVKEALDIPIAGGECEYTRFGFRDLISRRAVDIVQPDTCRVGGLSEAKKIAALCQRLGDSLFPPCLGHSGGHGCCTPSHGHAAGSPIVPKSPAFLPNAGPGVR